MTQITPFSDFLGVLESGKPFSVPRLRAEKTCSFIDTLFRRCFRRAGDDALEIARFFADELAIFEVKRDTILGLCRGASYTQIEQAVEAIRKRLVATLEQEEARLGLRSLFQRVRELLPQWRQSQSARKELEATNDTLGKKMEQAPGHRVVSELSGKLSAMRYRLVHSRESFGQMFFHDAMRRQEEWMQEMLLFWKATHFPVLAPGISVIEKRKINECVTYLDFVPRLQQDPLFAKEFFEFAFRNVADPASGAVSIGAEFPETMMRLRKVFLDKRISRYRDMILRCKLWGHKEVQLKIEGRFVPLSDETVSITFSTGLKKTIGQILDSFARKKIEPGELECLRQGIIHYPPRRPPVNLKGKKWWTDLAPFETLSRQSLEVRYHVVLQPGQGIIAINASRQFASGVRFDGSHSWFEAAIPNEDGSYQILPIGKYPDVSPFPSGACETALYTHATWPAYLNYPDANEFYNHRERVRVVHIASEIQLARWLDRIRLDLEAVREGRLYFQTQGENCAIWLQEILDDVFDGVYQGKAIPRYFEVDFPDTTAPVPIHHITNFYHFVSTKISRPVANVMRVAQGILLGAWRPYFYRRKDGSRTFTALMAYPHWYTGLFDAPSKLFYTAQGPFARVM